MYQLTLFILFISINSVSLVFAQDVIPDSTTKTNVQFANKTYTVSGGQIIGNINQFHSFELFNVYADETVNFTGPNSVKNIINRVTGVDQSWINGRLMSTIQGADLFLLNPNGVVFGPDAKLDIKGSFYVSTADYLKMQDDSKYYASPLKSSLLTSAPPASFGFLDSSIASITFEGGQTNKNNCPGLSVNESQTIAVVGGDINFKQGSFIDPDTIQFIDTTCSLYAPSGHIYLLSAASEGEIDFISDHPDLSLLNQLGNVTLSEHSLLDISGNDAGSIYIQSDQITFNDSYIKATSNGISEAHTGHSITLIADDIHFTNGSILEASSAGNGSGGNVRLSAKTILFKGLSLTTKGSSYISVSNFNNATSGDLILEANNITFLDGSFISACTYGLQTGPKTTLLASETILFKGLNHINGNKTSGSRIILRAYSDEDNAGDSGSLTMDAKNIRIEDGAFIAASTGSTGRGGEIILKAKESVILTGKNSRIEAVAMQHLADLFFNIGDGGSVNIYAKNIQIDNGAQIETSSYSGGKAGDITLQASHSIHISGVKNLSVGGVKANAFGRYQNAGDAGVINLQAPNIHIVNYGEISTSNTGPSKAGNIIIKANTIEIDQHSFVSSSSQSDGSNQEAGSISIESSNEIHIKNQSYISTSSNGTDMAGTIHLIAKNVLMDNATILSSSHSEQKAGDAGYIHIHSSKGIRLENNSSILTESVSSGGGMISVNAFDLLLIHSKISTSVKDFSGDGGKIHIHSKLVSLIDSGINADAYKGNGGVVNIETDNFIEDPQHSVTAISIYGHQGVVSIASLDKTGKIYIFDLNTNFLYDDQWLTSSCDQKNRTDVSRFIVSALLASPTSITDLKASPYSGQSLIANVKHSTVFNHSILSDYLQLKKDFDK
jgi:filamentous hemagglutinin family protein